MTTSPAPRLTLLDGFTLDLGRGRSRTLTESVPRGVQRLVAHLGVTGRASRAVVAGRLWPDVTEEHAHGSLRSALWRLHRMAPGLVVADPETVRLASEVLVDVHELDEWARRVRDPTSPIEEVLVPDAGLRGELLPGWYDDWVLLERERLRQRRLHALELVAERLVRARRHGEALEAAYAAVRSEPLRESAHRTVVRVHLAEGNVAEAVRAFEHYRALVADELGVEPTRLMMELVRGIPRRRHTVLGS